MKNKIFIGALTFFILLLSSCRSIKDPIYNGLSGISISKLGGEKSLLYLMIDYHNPNRSGLTLKKVEGQAWMDNNFLGNFYSDTTIHISGNSDFSIPVTLETDTKFMVKNMIAAVFNQDVLIKIDGKARVGKAGVFVNCPIHYEGTQKIGGFNQ